MPFEAGRDFAIKKNSTTIAAVTSKGVTWSGEPINVTSDDALAWATFVPDKFASEGVQIEVEGWHSDKVFSDIAFTDSPAGKHLDDITCEWSNGDTLSGNFILTNYKDGAQHDGAVQFSATLILNGAPTFTQA